MVKNTALGMCLLWNPVPLLVLQSPNDVLGREWLTIGWVTCSTGIVH